MDPQRILYRETLPHASLAPFIDAFWTVTGTNTTDQSDRILGDGCVDIRLNAGPGFLTEQGTVHMHTGEAYLTGTMTRFKDMVRPSGTQLVGVRFKPGGFTCFYDPAFLRSTADTTVPFDRSLFPSFNPTIDPTVLLNRFFLHRLKPSSRDILPLLADIRDRQGLVSVDQLVRRHFMTARTLQRLFDLHLAIGPKQFINFIRFQSAVQSIRNRRDRTLLDIACNHGYYDHAHLSNAFREYAGSTPSLCRILPNTSLPDRVS